MPLWIYNCVYCYIRAACIRLAITIPIDYRRNGCRLLSEVMSSGGGNQWGKNEDFDEFLSQRRIYLLLLAPECR